MTLRQKAAQLAAAVFGAVLLSGATAGTASPYSETTLYSFCSQPNCSDGARPEAGLISDSAGNMYGTTSETFSAADGGTVFELSPNGSGGWTYQVLYSFCEQYARRCKATYPVGELVIDVNGNLYGVTAKGGAGRDSGAIYELSPNAGRTAWTFKVIHESCGFQCDGYNYYAGLTYAGAAAGLPYDGTSPLYGTSGLGGEKNGVGTVFQLVPHGNRWTEIILYSFCPEFGCADGDEPEAAVIVDAAGHLFGTASEGGGGHEGVVFELTPHGKRKPWTEKALYSFCSGETYCPDGALPRSKLLMDGSGNLFGTTVFGGNPDCNVNGVYGCGVLFKLSPDGRRWREQVLHAFCTLSDCTDGSTPFAGVSMDAAGDLFGTTTSAGQNSRGTAYEYSASGFETIYQFCSQDYCADGASPESSLLLGTSGNLFGTANYFGRQGDFGVGSVFELSPQWIAQKKPRGR